MPTGTALKSKLLRLADEHPDDVRILKINGDGSIFAHISVSYVKISPPRQVSDEQKEAASERFKQMWKEKQENIV